MRFKDFLIEKYDQPRRVPEYVRELSPTGDWKELGGGVFAVVYEKPGPVPVAIKRSGGEGYDGVEDGDILIDKASGTTSDAYLNYILGIENTPALRDNPFLPQIYSIKFVSEYESETRIRVSYEIEMEKLKDLKVLKTQYRSFQDFMDDVENDPHSLASQLYNTLLQLTGPELFERVKSSFKSDESITTIDWFRRMMERINDNTSVVKNKQFKEAFDYIDSLGESFDLHYLNMMYRLTPSGIQLVITDPVF